MTAAEQALDRPVRLPRHVCAAIGLRALALQASFTYERFQGAGFGFALLPALRRIWPDRASQAAAVRRHMDYFNTNPVLAGYVLGAAARLEAEVAAGRAEISAVRDLKARIGGPVAALGDRLLWGTLRPLALTLGVLVALRAPVLGALLMLAVYNVPQLAWRARGLARGLAVGPEALRDITGARFARWTEALAAFWALAAGALATLLLFERALAGPLRWTALWLLLAGVSALLTARRRTSPTVLAALGLAVGLLLALLRIVG